MGVASGSPKSNIPKRICRLMCGKAVRNPTSGDFGLCNPLGNQVGARHPVAQSLRAPGRFSPILTRPRWGVGDVEVKGDSSDVARASRSRTDEVLRSSEKTRSKPKPQSMGGREARATAGGMPGSGETPAQQHARRLRYIGARPSWSAMLRMASMQKVMCSSKGTPNS